MNIPASTRLTPACLAAALSVVACDALAEPTTIIDVAGREVTLDTPVERVILGEGRQIYLLGALQPDNPFAGVVGWREDFSQADPDSYARYAEKFPQLEDLPTFGGFKDGTFDVEQAAALSPDVVLYNVQTSSSMLIGAWWELLAPCIALTLLVTGLALLNFAVDEIA